MARHYRRGYNEAFNNIKRDLKAPRSHSRLTNPYEVKISLPAPIPFHVANIVHRGLLLGRKLYGHI